MVKVRLKWNKYLITLQINKINYKANMLQNEGFKSYLLYHDHCKSDRKQEVRKEKE